MPDEAQEAYRDNDVSKKPFLVAGYEKAPKKPSRAAADEVLTGRMIYMRDAPKLYFIVYDGKYEESPFFKAQVMDAIHSQVSNVQVLLLSHLRDRLIGQAFQAVHGALLTGASFGEV